MSDSHLEDKFDLYVGSEIGLVKRVNLGKEFWDNDKAVSQLSKEDEITCMCWDDADENVVCYGCRNHNIVEFNTNSGESVAVTKCNTGKGPLCGISRFDENYVTCSESGLIKVWQGENEKGSKEIGGGICRMRQNVAKPNVVATGGKENELKLWDLEQLGDSTFQAKNVSNDFLNLRVPVWVTDIGFLSNSDKVVTCTGRHQVRVYDPLCGQRRPVLDLSMAEDHPLTCLSVRGTHQQVIVGSSQGRLTLVDLRAKGNAVQCYKGFSGSIRDVHCSDNAVITCGLDRFLRVHDIDNKKLIHKMYLKSRLNCLLCHSNIVTGRTDGDVEKSAKDARVKDHNDNNNGDNDADQQDVEELWDQMDTVTSTKVKKLKRTKTRDEGTVTVKKKKLKKTVS